MFKRSGALFIITVEPWLPTLACKVSPPLGVRTVKLDVIVKGELEVSILQVGSAKSVKRTLTVEEGVLGITQGNEPLAGVVEITLFQFKPPS